ncbi:MAG TPA: CHAD domain-containing protein [bacterium]|nr:CHAD domain-containing protein [bacterium]
MKKSLKVRGVDPSAPYKDMARLVIRDRMRRVMDLSKRYLKTHDEEDLHQLRIAFRRLRYPLECFVDCFPRRMFNTVLDRIDLLQNATGQVRDLDVMLDLLRTRANGALVAYRAGEPLEAVGGESESAGHILDPALLASIESLEAERAVRVAALEGALEQVLQSGGIKRFRKYLKG